MKKLIAVLAVLGIFSLTTMALPLPGYRFHYVTLGW